MVIRRSPESGEVGTKVTWQKSWPYLSSGLQHPYRKTETVTSELGRTDHKDSQAGQCSHFRFQDQCETLSPNIKNDRIDSQFHFPSFTCTCKGGHTCIDKHATCTHTQ